MAVTRSPGFMRPRSLDRVSTGPTWLRRLDLVFIGLVLALAFCGLLMIHSATRGSGFVVRQALWMVLGLSAMAVTVLVDYRRLNALAPWLFGITVAILMSVVSPLGQTSKGTQAWFQLGSIQVEPSEYAKLVIITCLAAFAAKQRAVLSGRGAGSLEHRYIGVMVAITGIPMGLILLQPDLGTALVFVAILGGVLLSAGASGRSLLVLVLLAVVSAVAVVQLGVLKQYQLDRLGVFLDPTSNTQEAAYNLNQSKIAIGSGGLTGKGLYLGSQTNLRYVPEQHTDFIFTVVGEELGFLGGATLLSLYALLLWRIWQAAKRAPDRFGTLLCTGVLAMLSFQVFENIGMTMGIMPITGIPLPLVSYGGSSALATFLALGLVLNVRLRSGD